ncbi:glycerophosphodiester phosphodiesterase family protein [Candidatus Uabimicrobium sp. HlEnr_7]|uniref:glycerophosphodiester phosphodiesterase family protein n=1 Tax=Candidatus Uabimicrobium helgolandensis TaxID=3095367 RepID=UPI00355768F7
MKKYMWLLLIIFALGCNQKPQDKNTQAHYINLKTVSELQNYLSYKEKQPALVSAHRGGPMPGYPENAIETFENALKYAPCILEFDVNKTKDGKLILMHDDTLDRTTTGSGNVNEKTWEELQKLYLKDESGKITEYKIPTFEDVLVWGRTRAVMCIDIKRGIEPQEIVNMIHKTKAQKHSIVIVYNRPMLQKYHKIDSSLCISASAGTVKSIEETLALGVPSKNLIMFVGISEPKKEVYEFLHKKGIKAILGTMHNLDNSALKKGDKVYQKLIENGADVLATDNVKLATSAIRKRK